MDKKMIYAALAIALVVLGASVVTAIVTPPGNMKDPAANKIWGAIMDLQGQITTLTGAINDPDSGLQGQINTLSGRVDSQDTALQGKIDDITDAVDSGDTNLQNQIDEIPPIPCTNCQCPEGQFVVGFDTVGSLICVSPSGVGSKLPTTLTPEEFIWSGPPSINLWYLRAKLQDNAGPLKLKMVYLRYSKDNTEWSYYVIRNMVFIGLTNSEGYVTAQFYPEMPWEGYYKFVFDGDDTYASAESSVVHFAKAPTQFSTVTIQWDYMVKKYVMRGFLWDEKEWGIEGKKVSLMYSTDKSEWSPYLIGGVPSIDTTNYAGLSTIWFDPEPPVQGYYKLVFDGDDHYASAESNAWQFT